MSSLDTHLIRDELARALVWTGDASRAIAVYGAGDSTERNMWSFVETVEKDTFSPEYFIDDTPEKHHIAFHDRLVINFEEAHRLCRGFQILVCSDVPKTRGVILNSLRQHPIEGASDVVTLDKYIFCRHAKEILSVYDMLEDDLSKATYANMILIRMAHAQQDHSLVNERTYYALPEFMNGGDNEVYVDCGAYTGDTVEQYLTERKNTVHQIVAFEPSEINFRELSSRVEKLKKENHISDTQIRLIKAGIGERSYQVKPVCHSDAVNIGYNLLGGCVTDDECVAVVSIDDFFANQSVSFLKADIEGYEYRMLCGAQQVIRRDKPKMAVCIYHSSSDMYRIALKIKAIRPDYQLSVRQHSHGILDTVLYAY